MAGSHWPGPTPGVPSCTGPPGAHWEGAGGELGRCQKGGNITLTVLPGVPSCIEPSWGTAKRVTLTVLVLDKREAQRVQRVSNLVPVERAVPIPAGGQRVEEVRKVSKHGM